MIEKKKRVRLKNRDKSRDYVDGPTLQKHLLEWYESGKEEIPRLIVDAILQVINRLGTSGKFNGYSYLEEMKGDATIACIAALNLKKYDPYKYDNPFAYFTQISWNAFINVINIEHKQSYLKHKSLEAHFQTMALAGESLHEVSATDGLDNDLIEKFENKQKQKKKKQSIEKDIDQFMENDNE